MRGSLRDSDNNETGVNNAIDLLLKETKDDEYTLFLILVQDGKGVDIEASDS